MKYIYIVCYICVGFATQAQDLSVTFSKLEEPCKLAEASVTASTTSLPIQYLWSNGTIANSVSELQPGEYSVKVTADNGKDTTIHFIIEELSDAIYLVDVNYFPGYSGVDDLSRKLSEMLSLKILNK